MRNSLPIVCAHTCPANNMCGLALQVTDYLERQNDERNQAKVALRRVEHFYYKTDVVSLAKICSIVVEGRRCGLSCWRNHLWGRLADTATRALPD